MIALIDWEWYEHHAPLILLITSIATGVWLIRRKQPGGLAAFVTSIGIVPANLLTRFSEWAEGRRDVTRNHISEHGDKAVGRTHHRLAAGILHVALAGLWLVTMLLLLRRNQSIVMKPYHDAVARGGIAPRPGEAVVKLAEVFGPVLLVAVAGVLVTEIIGLSKHVAFIQNLPKWPKLITLGIAALLVVPGVAAQMSVAKQERAAALTEVRAGLEQVRDVTIVPLPAEPTTAEIAAWEQANADFINNVEAPAIQEYNAGLGPLGWRNLLPIVAVVLDFLLGWSVVPALICLWLVGGWLLQGFLHLVAAASRGLSFAARLVSGALLSILGLQAPAALPIQQAAPDVGRPAPPAAPPTIPLAVPEPPREPGPRSAPSVPATPPPGPDAGAAGSPREGSFDFPRTPRIPPRPSTPAPESDPRRWNPLRHRRASSDATALTEHPVDDAAAAA